jgi:ER-bound oxygenase mpaB/B'/Rubber oxygenase, catalytic domain
VTIVRGVRESPHLQEIRRLDPVADHSRIVYLDTCFEFPWDTTRSLELALFRTFAVPSVAAVLDSSGEFGRAPQKRYDDTDLILSTIVEAGYESEDGKRAIRRMNRIHGRFEVSNEDFLYVLSSFVFEPIRWNARFGWRPLIEAEKLATFEFWREVGRRMAIRDLPATYRDLERLNEDYERRHFQRTEASERVGRATRNMFLAWFPGLPKRLGAHAIYALMDDGLLDAFGFPRPSRALRASVEAALRTRGKVVAFLPPRRRPRLRTRRRTRTYGRDWQLEALGPELEAPDRSV